VVEVEVEDEDMSVIKQKSAPDHGIPSAGIARLFSIVDIHKD
jgi:hypothetical protein